MTAGQKERLKKWGIPAGCALLAIGILWSYLALFSTTFHIQETVYLYIDTDDTADSVKTKIQETGRPGISSGFSFPFRRARSRTASSGSPHCSPIQSASSLVKKDASTSPAFSFRKNRSSSRQKTLVFVFSKVYGETNRNISTGKN